MTGLDHALAELHAADRDLRALNKSADSLAAIEKFGKTAGAVLDLLRKAVDAMNAENAARWAPAPVVSADSDQARIAALELELAALRNRLGVEAFPEGVAKALNPDHAAGAYLDRSFLDERN